MLLIVEEKIASHQNSGKAAIREKMAAPSTDGTALSESLYDAVAMCLVLLGKDLVW